MPCCAVRVCGNRSSETNYKTCGITYHRFPKDPIVKEKWIDACGRKEDWFPTQHGVICSSHFEEKYFQPIAKSRRLFPEAVPTLKLRLVFENPSDSEPTQQKITTKKTIIKPGEKRSIVEKYKVQIQKYKKGLQKHKMHIKRLQTMVRRYRQKVDVMKNILTALKNENAIAVEHHWLLESDGVSFST